MQTLLFYILIVQTIFQAYSTFLSWKISKLSYTNTLPWRLLAIVFLAVTIKYLFTLSQVETITVLPGALLIVNTVILNSLISLFSVLATIHIYKLLKLRYGELK